MPTERAHGLQVMHMCDAFAYVGFKVHLLVPNRRTQHTQDPFSFYNIAQNFEIARVRCVDLFPYAAISRRVCFWIAALTFSCALLFKLKMLRKGIVFSRDPVSSFFLMWFHPRVCLEVHDAPAHTLTNRILYRRLKYIVVTNSWKKQQLIGRFNVTPENIFIAHHGVDISMFTHVVSRDQAKELIHFSSDKKLVIYCGHLFDWKGVYTLARAAQFLSDDVELVFVGGTQEDIARFKEFVTREKLPRINVVGFVPHGDIPLYLSAAHVLVLPTSAQYSIGRNESAPLKLFEYMTAGRPIVASDLPAIRDIVSDAEVWFTEPDSARALAASVVGALNHPQRTVASAFELVKEQTWVARAKKIKEFMGCLENS